MSPLAFVLAFNLLFYVLVARRIRDVSSRLASISLANVALSIFGFVMAAVCHANASAWACR